MSHPMYAVTSAKNSAERLALITLDALIAAMKVMAAELDADATRVDVAATGLLNITSDITLTSAAEGSDRNGDTVLLRVNPAAANPTNTILVTFDAVTGHSPSAMRITVTPNDGTHNSSVAVGLTSAKLVELINTGAVAGKVITLTDNHGFRVLQTASGGGAATLADGGEGDNVTATFSGGITSYATMLEDITDIRQALGIREEDFKI